VLSRAKQARFGAHAVVFKKNSQDANETTPTAMFRPYSWSSPEVIEIDSIAVPMRVREDGVVCARFPEPRVAEEQKAVLVGDLRSFGQPARKALTVADAARGYEASERQLLYFFNGK